MASAERRYATDFGGALGYFAYLVLGSIVIAAFGVFFYGRVLDASQSAKDTQLKNAEAAIDPVTVKSFVQLRDRLNASQTLLGGHTALSSFFSTLESILPSTVRFTSLHIAIDTAGAAKVEGAGISKTFNALSVASAAFATDGRIKDVIFSKMNINKDSSISFGFSATLDPKLTVFSPSSSQPIVPAATATTTP